MRLATFNVENMFERVKAMALDTWAEGKPVLEDHARLNELIQEPAYSAAVKTELLTIMKRHTGLLTRGVSRFVRLRDIRGKLVRRSPGKPAEIAPSGRADWIGWFDLEKDAVKETATENTARVIGLVDPDVLCVMEAENRITLKRFNDDVLSKVGVAPFDHVMLIDGNDDRGIDVGILATRGCRITRMLSHVDDTDAQGTIFSRDCAEYEITTPLGNKLLLLVNHFKSKGYGKAAESAAKRLRQAKRVREIYQARSTEGYDLIAVVGDLNENPTEPPLDPLLRDGRTLRTSWRTPSSAVTAGKARTATGQRRGSWTTF